MLYQKVAVWSQIIVDIQCSSKPFKTLIAIVQTHLQHVRHNSCRRITDLLFSLRDTLMTNFFFYKIPSEGGIPVTQV